MPWLRLVADVIYHYEELIRSYPVRSINVNNIGNSFCLQRLVSVVKFVAGRGLVFWDDENVGAPRIFFQINFKLFSSKSWKKEHAILLVTGFATVSQIANHCQILCCIIKFCYSWLTNVTSQDYVIRIKPFSVSSILEADGEYICRPTLLWYVS